MKNVNIRNFLQNRKILYLILSIVLVSVFSLTIAYAVLSTVLEIKGNAEVSAASWDVYLDNVQLYSGSVTTGVPTIVDKTTASFTTILKSPGDYYMFTIDVVNNGSIDAMIDNIEKSPTLTSEQTKYLNYIVEYQNGESINTKQLVKANSFVRLKVRVELRRDILSTDLPQNAETFNLSFKVNYVQADETNTSTIPNSGKLVRVVSGDYDTVGSEICIGEECFYVISSTDYTVTMLAKYNLHVGNKYDRTNGPYLLENPTGIQDESAIAYFKGYTPENPIVASSPFSLSSYWSDTEGYPSYVYNENSIVYKYVENYRTYLEKYVPAIESARLMTISEVENLGCSRSSNRCSNAAEWVYSTSYWLGSADSSSGIWRVDTDGDFLVYDCANNGQGVRPVIRISKSFF